MRNTSTTNNSYSTFTPEEVADAIRPYLSVLTVQDMTDYIQFSRKDNARRLCTVSFIVRPTDQGRLYISLRELGMEARYVENIEELRNVLERELSDAARLDNLRSLLGLKEQKQKQEKTA